MSTLLGYCAVVCAPVGLVVSLIGVVKDTRRGRAIAGVVLSALPVIVLFAGLVQFLCR